MAHIPTHTSHAPGACLLDPMVQEVYHRVSELLGQAADELPDGLRYRFYFGFRL